MLNFEYSIPTEIFFGKDQIKVLGREIKKYGTNVLLVYGGGSIKRNGIYDRVMNIFSENGIKFWELSGVEPNPRIETVRKGIEICRENKIDLILAVGGGSTIDCSKVIGAGYYYEGDAWDIVKDSGKIINSLPIATILTLAATGSEMNKGAVISNLSKNEKQSTGHKSMAPKFSILDPTYTFTVPRHQTAAGTADILCHVFEVYFSTTESAFVQNRLAEGIMKTCIEYGRKAMDEPDNYEARANLMWASSLAINGLLSLGKIPEWTMHALEHELSAFYDITHGVGLGILMPRWMEFGLNEKTMDKFCSYAINVWDVDKNLPKEEIAKLGIEKTREFIFSTLEIPSNLRSIDIDEEYLERMAEKAVSHGKDGVIGNFVKIDKEGALKIFRDCL